MTRALAALTGAAVGLVPVAAGARPAGPDGLSHAAVARVGVSQAQAEVARLRAQAVDALLRHRTALPSRDRLRLAEADLFRRVTALDRVVVDGSALSAGAAAVAAAARALGTPYHYGGVGPRSFDCSGLTAYAWRAAGVSLPHSSAAQYRQLPHVAVAALRPGDLVFYGHPIGHVGIYVGDGMMIEAPTTGSRVRYAPIGRPDLVGGGRPG